MRLWGSGYSMAMVCRALPSARSRSTASLAACSANLSSKLKGSSFRPAQQRGSRQRGSGQAPERADQAWGRSCCDTGATAVTARACPATRQGTGRAQRGHPLRQPGNQVPTGHCPPARTLIEGGGRFSAQAHAQLRLALAQERLDVGGGCLEVPARGAKRDEWWAQREEGWVQEHAWRSMKEETRPHRGNTGQSRPPVHPANGQGNAAHPSARQMDKVMPPTHAPMPPTCAARSPPASGTCWRGAAPPGTAPA